MIVSEFRRRLLTWFATNERPLPWKGEKDPYRIWLSEIMLQQTTVTQGKPYFDRFCATFPTVFDLAAAPEDAVFKLWEGLGYYARARNLHATARYIATECQGQFPTTYEAILALKGVGPYTAAAIASFAYGLPHAVLDGNVFRVLARIFGIETPIDTTIGKKQFAELAQQLLDTDRPADFNQAMMDFGATQCTPQQPICSRCPFKTECQARALGKIAEWPVKEKKIQKKDRYFNYLVLEQGPQTVVTKRMNKDIWQNLYEFPLVETSELIDNFAQSAAVEIKNKINELLKNDWKLTQKSMVFKQILTHQRIFAQFWTIETTNLKAVKDEKYIHIDKKNVKNFAFPKVFDLYFQENSLTLF